VCCGRTVVGIDNSIDPYRWPFPTRARGRGLRHSRQERAACRPALSTRPRRSPPCIHGAGTTVPGPIRDGSPVQHRPRLPRPVPTDDGEVGITPGWPVGRRSGIDAIRSWLPWGSYGAPTMRVASPWDRKVVGILGLRRRGLWECAVGSIAAGDGPNGSPTALYKVDWFGH
jgi:hypothetical protein